MISHILLYIEKSGLKPTIKMVIDPSNVEMLYDSILYLARPQCRISFDINMEVEWDQKFFNIFFAQISKVIQNYSKLYKRNSSVREIDKIIEHIKGNNFFALDCGAGRTYIALKPNGDVYPCSRFAGMQEFCMGNILNGFNDFEKTKEIQNYSVNKHICVERKCKLFSVCACKCLYLNYGFTGSIYKAGNLQCAIQRALINYFLKYHFETI